MIKNIKNLSWVEAGWAAIGAETGNKKYDELNKQYLDLNKDNLGIIQSVIQTVGIFLVHYNLPERLRKFYLILHWSLITSEKQEVLPLM
ncbi:hypothetical protein [Rickettsia australis]|uniref:hypothetical protein n=1 Tax=Rickettsia australis TaxID=787 RepID=UPI0002F0F506|nr:hypothetical protein [Rickettsia australis]